LYFNIKGVVYSFGMEMLLDKIRVSESTKTDSKRPCSRRRVYQCRCWFAMATGYDWSSPGGEGKVTWTVIANKSGVGKQKKFCTEQWFFLVNFRTVATNVFLKKLEGKTFISVNLRKKLSKNGKIWQNFQTTKLERKRKKKHGYKGIYVCAV